MHRPHHLVSFQEFTMLSSASSARNRSFIAQAVLASITALGTATAMPVVAQTAAPPARTAAVPPATAAAPAVSAGAMPAAAASAAKPPQRAASQTAPKVAGVAPLPPQRAAQTSSTAKSNAAPQGAVTGNAPARWVALDVGHVPGGGSRSASGVAEHNFNLRFAAALEAKLKQQGVSVRRLPTSLSLADRATRAHGAMLVVSVHHDGTSVTPARAASGAAAGTTARKVPAASNGSGFQLRVGQSEPTACARAVATQLQTAGRHFSTRGAGPWADKALGVRAGGEGALLQQAEVPVLQISVADIANPAEERLANSQPWLERQVAAIAKGLGLCLQRPAAGAPALPPAAAASAARRA